VAYVCNTFPKVSETFVAGELAELCRRGVDVRIFSRRLPDEAVRHAVVERAGLLARTSYELDAFTEQLREERPQLLHAHFATEPAELARNIAHALGVPFTFTAHAYDIYRRPPADIAERVAAAAAVVTVSEANAAHMVGTLGVPADRLHVIPCGVDLEGFEPPEEASTQPRIVCISRLRPHKNVALLLDACRRLRDDGVAFTVAIIGDGSERPALEELRARYGLDGVQFMGALEQGEVRDNLQSARLSVLPSDSEGFPVSLMEAAACGVPAVGTDVGGVAELIDDGVTGFVVPQGDAVALAGAMKRILTDPELAGSMSAAARRRAEQSFSVQRQVDRLVAVWAGALSQAQAQ